MMKFKIPLLAGIFCLAITQFAFSQVEETFDFYTRGDYRASVPRPQSILRYDVGDFHTTYAQMEQVMNSIAAAAPDRVKIYDIGLTNEHRMQHLVAISSPENIARLDEIKANIARLADPRKTSASDAALVVQNTPAIAWMAYAIHGNESASFEAMMQVMYQLAASNEPATLDILKNVVTLMVIGTLIATAAAWNALQDRRLRTWWTWIVWAGFMGCTAAVMIPRAYSVKQFMSTGWPFVILVVVWSLTDGGRDDDRQSPAARLARLRLPSAAALSLIAAIVIVAAPRADWRGVVAYLNTRAAATAPGALSVWLDPHWNSTPYDYYRPKIAATAPLLSAGLAGRNAPAADVCLVAERFGKAPPTSPSEAWLDNHYRLVDVVPFARLELRCYTNRTASTEEEIRRSGG